MSPAARMTAQHLIFDADDTLWENNIYFERAIEEFLDLLDLSSLSRREARAVLDEIERANADAQGYGSRAFARNLRVCYERLAERRIDEHDLRLVMAFGERILAQAIEPIAGVPETLAALAERHELTLLTKGDAEEQRRKIERSGLASYFRHAEIVPEKDVAAYGALVIERQFDPGRAWMIGNSPKSDINPALAAGLHAVFIPHAATWRLEHAEIVRREGSGRLLRIEHFSALLEHF